MGGKRTLHVVLQRYIHGHMKLALLTALLSVAACSGAVRTDADAVTTDTDAVTDAKLLCAKQTEQQLQPDRGGVRPPGGLEPFTRCMLEQANAKIGAPAFSEICSAIPGSRTDSPDGHCFV